MRLEMGRDAAADGYINLDWMTGGGRADVWRGSADKSRATRVGAHSAAVGCLVAWDGILRLAAERRAKEEGGGGSRRWSEGIGRRKRASKAPSGPFTHVLILFLFVKLILQSGSDFSQSQVSFL